MDVNVHRPTEATAEFFDDFATIAVEDDTGSTLAIFIHSDDSDFLVELVMAVKLVTGVMIHGEARPTE